MLEKTAQRPRDTAATDTRLPSLDGWRAVAITIVLVSHAWAANNPAALSEILLPLSSKGDFGVRIFFVLSGFLITHILIQEHRHSGSISLRNFYIRRTLRIFPVYYLYLLVLASLQAVSLYTDEYGSWIGSLTFTRNVLGRGQSASVHLWSLAVEEQFYLAWPIMIVALNLCVRWRLAIATLLVVISVAFAIRVLDCDQDTFVCLRLLGQRSIFRYADSLAIGCIGAFLRANVELVTSRNLKTALLYTCVTMLALSSAISTTTNWESSSLVLAQAVLTMACLALSISARDTLIFKILNSREFSYIGLISYSLYIWHLLFLSGFAGSNLSGNILYHGYTWWVVAVLVASVSFFLFERPIAGLKAQLQYSKLVLQKTATATP